MVFARLCQLGLLKLQMVLLLLLLPLMWAPLSSATYLQFVKRDVPSLQIECSASKAGVESVFGINLYVTALKGGVERHLNVSISSGDNHSHRVTITGNTLRDVALMKTSGFASHNDSCSFLVVYLREFADTGTTLGSLTARCQFLSSKNPNEPKVVDPTRFNMTLLVCYPSASHSDCRLLDGDVSKMDICLGQQLLTPMKDAVDWTFAPTLKSTVTTCAGHASSRLLYKRTMGPTKLLLYVRSGKKIWVDDQYTCNVSSPTPCKVDLKDVYQEHATANQISLEKEGACNMPVGVTVGVCLVANVVATLFFVYYCRRRRIAQHGGDGGDASESLNEGKP